MAGAHGRQLFDPEILPVIFRYTGGVPRLVNTFCDTALLFAFSREAGVTITELKAAIEELQWVEYAARTNRMRAGSSARSRRSPRPISSDEVLARIIVAHGGEHVEERPLRMGRLIIGRTGDNDIQIDSKYVSRHHCQITTTPEGSMLEDLNSTNGVYVKSKRVRRHHLNDGDVVVLGKHEIMYLDERSARLRDQAHEPTGDHPVVGGIPGAEEDAEDESDAKSGTA